MGDLRQTIFATGIAHHTGTVWSASFPMPPDKFLTDFTWNVAAPTGRNLNWVAYMMRHETGDDGKPVLTIRFDDREQPPISDASMVTAKLVSPSY
jgi:hypothetical protein